MADRLLPRPKDAFATATRVVKLECSTHACVGQVFLFVREGKTDDQLKMACPTDTVAKYLVAMALKDIHGLPRRCYSLLLTPNAQNPSHTATIAAFLLGFHSKNQTPPAKNGSATATITIKPKCLAHLCVEQDLLYGCVTLAGLNFTEGKMNIFLHHLQYNFTQGDLFCCPKGMLYTFSLVLCTFVSLKGNISTKHNHCQHKGGHLTLFLDVKV